MAKLTFELVAPERIIFSGDVDAVVLPASEGDMTVLPGHAPLMTALKTGFLVITDTVGNGRRVLVRGGFADVNPRGLTVLAAVAASVVSIPDRQPRFMMISSAIALAAWLAWIISAASTANVPHVGHGWKCLRNIVLLGAPLGMLMYYLISRAAPLRTGTAGWLAALSAAAAANLKAAGYEDVLTEVGDGTQGWPAGAPYAAILVTNREHASSAVRART